MGYTVKSHDQILEDWIAWVVANAPQITDMSPGSVIRSFCEGGSLAIEEAYVAVYLGFRRYLDDIKETVFDFVRKTGTKATAAVVFSRIGSTGLVSIPSGTRLKTPTGLRFISTSASFIADGNTSSDLVEVEAELIGISYNVEDDSITVIEDQINGVETVTNGLPATGGVDSESNLSFENRFQAYIEGLGKSNVAGLIEGASSVEGITSVSLVEHFPPIDDAPNFNISVSLYIDDGSTDGVSLATVAIVQDIIDGDGTEDNPGYRAAGVNVLVIKPAIQSEDIDVTITVLAGVDIDQLENDVITAITQYVNTLSVGSDILYNEIVAAVMGVYGVVNCDVTDPLADVTVAATQVGRVGTITITIS